MTNLRKFFACTFSALISSNNAYQFIGTNYSIAYNAWVTVAIIFGIVAAIFLFKSTK